MKVQIVGSHMCPGCVEILEEMKKRNVEVDFVNIFEDFSLSEILSDVTGAGGLLCGDSEAGSSV